jgi:hypothetical protein
VEVTPLPGSATNFSCNGGASNSCSSPKSALSSPLRLSMGRSSQQGSLSLLASGSAAQRASVQGSFGAAAAAAVNAKAGVTYLFPCDAWLDERLGDGKTERRLLAAR